MRRITTILATLVVLGLSACAQNGVFDNPDGGADVQFGDPGSVTFFQTSVGDRVLFPVDQSTLTPDAQAILAAQAAWLAENPGYTAVIEGHADEQGTREYNLALGARRANSARDYLVSRGIPASALKTVTFGKERPIAICSEEACYSQNRRAVTVLQAGGGL